MQDKYELRIVSKVLEAKVYGAWSENTAKRFASDIQSMAQRLKHKPWGALVDCTLWELGTPQTESVLNELTVWCANNKLCCKADVISEDAIKRFQIEKYVKAANESDGIQKFFTTLEQAKAHLTHLDLY